MRDGRANVEGLFVKRVVREKGFRVKESCRHRMGSAKLSDECDTYQMDKLRLMGITHTHTLAAAPPTLVHKTTFTSVRIEFIAHRAQRLYLRILHILFPFRLAL